MESYRIRKALKFNILFLFLPLAIIFSCSNDDDRPEEIEITISVEDLTLNVDEFPVTNYVLGRVHAETNRGSLRYTLQEQNPHDALLINESTGELLVKDSSLFNFDVNPIITATVKVSNEDIFENANITIHINEPQASAYHSMIDEDNIWVNESYTGDGMSDTFIQRKMYIKDQETVNGKVYFNLYTRVIDYKFGTRGWGRHDNSVGEEIFLYRIREDVETKKVYSLDSDNNEVLLYDFSLSMNGIVDLWDPTTNLYITQEVSEITEITLLDGETRKMIIFESGTSIIESIGYNRVSTRGAASLIGFFNDNTLLLKDQYHEFGEDFWEEGKAPQITIDGFSLVNNEAIFKSELISDGGNYVENNILEKGICWSTTPNPTVEDNHTSEFVNEHAHDPEVATLKKFYSSVSNIGFQPNSVYYFRSYSKNSNGIAYSETEYQINSGFLTSSLFTQLLSKEYFEGSYRIRLKGGITSNNFPSEAGIVEKGFARSIKNENDKPVHGPFEVSFLPVEEGNLDDFELETVFSRGDSYGYRVVFYWSYVKFDDGQVVYGEQLVVPAD